MIIPKPGDTWDRWPPGLLRQGDLIHVEWTYFGMSGSTSSEETLLLLLRKEEFEEEIWDVACIQSGKIESFMTVSCDDYKNEDEGDHHKVTLIERSDCAACNS